MATRTDWWRMRKPHKFSWMNDTLKKRIYGSKSQESNGSKKEKKTPPYFIEPWFSKGTTIESSNCTTTRVKLFTPSNKSRRSSFITSRSY